MKVKFKNSYFGRLGNYYKYDEYSPSPNDRKIYELTDGVYEILKDDCEIYTENIIDKIKRAIKGDYNEYTS